MEEEEEDACKAKEEENEGGRARQGRANEVDDDAD